MTTEELENYEPKGQLIGFPKEIIARMLECQEEQGNKRDVSVFEKKIYAGRSLSGFDWDDTKEAKDDWDFWAKVIDKKNFDLFFEKYPKKEEVKTCSKCHKEKPLSEFHKRGNTVRPECKECRKQEYQELKNNKNMQKNNKKEEDSQEFRVGDKVYDILIGEIGIVELKIISTCQLKVVFETGITKYYSIEGKYFLEYKNPHLLHYRDDYDYSVIDFNNLPKRQETKRWRAKKGEIYYIASHYFTPAKTRDYRMNDDNESYNSGNYFQTKEQAQEVADMLKKYFQELINPNK